MQCLHIYIKCGKRGRQNETFKLKYGRCAKIGHVIKLLNYETVQDAESAAIRDVLDKVQHNII